RICRWISFFIVLLSPDSTLFPYTTLFRSRRPLTLCLLGLDRPGDGGPAVDPSDLESRMGRIDQLLLRELGRFDVAADHGAAERLDRKSTRLNSSHSQISYAVFCLKKKNTR